MNTKKIPKPHSFKRLLVLMISGFALWLLWSTNTDKAPKKHRLKTEQKENVIPKKTKPKPKPKPSGPPPEAAPRPIKGKNALNSRTLT